MLTICCFPTNLHTLPTTQFFSFLSHSSLTESHQNGLPMISSKGTLMDLFRPSVLVSVVQEPTIVGVSTSECLLLPRWTAREIATTVLSVGMCCKPDRYFMFIPGPWFYFPPPPSTFLADYKQCPSVRS
jgi:hypothetical protein